MCMNIYIYVHKYLRCKSMAVHPLDAPRLARRGPDDVGDGVPARQDQVSEVEASKQTNECPYTYIYIYTYIHIIYISTHMCIYIYIGMYIYTYM